MCPIQDQGVRLQDDDNVKTLCFELYERGVDILRSPSIRTDDRNFKFRGGALISSHCGVALISLVSFTILIFRAPGTISAQTQAALQAAPDRRIVVNHGVDVERVGPLIVRQGHRNRQMVRKVHGKAHPENDMTAYCINIIA